MRKHDVIPLICLSLLGLTAPRSRLAAAHAHRLDLWTRQNNNNDRCGGDSSLTSCSSSSNGGDGDVPNLPSNFCCPAKTACLVLKGDRSVICCPDGQDCQFIRPVSCDVTLLNATAHPRNAIHSTDLSSLDKCGTGCCPPGYECQNGQCSKQKRDESTKPSESTKPTSSSPALSTSTPPSSSAAASSSSSPTTTSLASANNSNNADGTLPTCPSSPPSFSAKSFVAGLFPGLILGALLALTTLMFLGRKKKISAPILTTSTSQHHHQPGPVRTDFLLRRPASETASMEFILADDPPPSTMQTTPPPPPPPIPPSSSSSTSSPNRNKLSRMTAFSDLMETAGFRKGEPFIVSSSSHDDSPSQHSSPRQPPRGPPPASSGFRGAGGDRGFGR